MQALVDCKVMMDTFQLRDLFEKHHELVMQSALRVTGNLEDAEDALQTVFMRLTKREKLPDLDEGAKPYLHRAAVNAALDIMRFKKSRRSLPIEEMAFALEDEARPGPEKLRSSAELQSLLREAISHLNERAAEVFILRYIEGYSNQEIAEMIGTSPGTVAVTLHRTRGQLRQEIKSFLGGKNE